MIPRLQKIACLNLTPFIRITNVLGLLLLACSYNSTELEEACLEYMSLHEDDLLGSKEWQYFLSKLHKPKSNGLL